MVEPARFVNTARYRLPDIETFVGEILSVRDLAPRTENHLWRLVDACHLTVSAEHSRDVDAAARNQARAGAVTVVFAG